MQQTTFIRLEHTFEEAMYYRNSPVMNQYYFSGVQLLPFNLPPDARDQQDALPYIQRTYTRDGVELEDWNVFVYDMCGNELAEITTAFDVIPFQDPSTGLPQVIWQLKNIQFDAGLQLIYLKIINGDNEEYFSSPFYITADEKEYTSRWDYKNKDSDTMLSTQLRIYYSQESEDESITNYTETTTGRERNNAVSITDYEIWLTDVIDARVLKLFKSIFRNKYVYSDFIRTGKKDPTDTPRFEGFENHLQTEVMLLRNYADVYNPNYVPIPLPDPEINYSIELTALDGVSNFQVKYTYNTVNIPPTDELVFSWSLDGVLWPNGYLAIQENPKTINVYDYLDNDFFYSVFHPPTNTRSNALQIKSFFIFINNITGRKLPLGNGYYTIYIQRNFVPLFYFGYSVDVSTDGVTWINGITTIPANSQATEFSIIPPSSSGAIKYFRVRYDDGGSTYGIVLSNVFEFELP